MVLSQPDLEGALSRKTTRIRLRRHRLGHRGSLRAALTTAVSAFSHQRTVDFNQFPTPASSESMD
jgi:hypothetical protein